MQFNKFEDASFANPPKIRQSDVDRKQRSVPFAKS